MCHLSPNWRNKHPKISLVVKVILCNYFFYIGHCLGMKLFLIINQRRCERIASWDWWELFFQNKFYFNCLNKIINIRTTTLHYCYFNQYIIEITNTVSNLNLFPFVPDLGIKRSRMLLFTYTLHGLLYSSGNVSLEGWNIYSLLTSSDLNQKILKKNRRVYCKSNIYINIIIFPSISIMQPL